ncbi:MAG: alanine racemase [Rhodocyclaceae bacterium]|nr:alanine racemase [Rhodocyclaceae bacterium]
MLVRKQTARWQAGAADDSGSLSLAELAESFGTPFYLTVSAAIDERIGELREALPAGMRLLYSIKANPLLGIVARLAGQVDGFDVASAAELESALACGVSGGALSMTGPGKRDDDLAAAVACGARVVLESEDEARRLARLAAGATARVLLRVNPPFELAAEARMGGGPRKFGVDSEQAGEVLRAIGRLPLAFEGLHVYPGSNCLDAGAIAAAQRAALALAAELLPFAPAPLRTLNLGGGFGIPCFPGEQPLDLAALGEAMHEVAREAARRLPACELSLELGRYVVGEAGAYVARVLERKASRGRTYLILDGGLHHHWHATGALEGRRHLHFPMWVVGGDDRPLEEVTVCGPLCAPHDTWAENLSLPRAAPGDLVIVYQSGAYGAGASPVGFMQRPEAAQVLA